MYVIHELRERTKIGGTKLSIYQCRHVPDEEDILIHGRDRFEINNDEYIFHEVYISGKNKPFFSSKTKPTRQEIEFQLIEHNKTPIINFFKSIFS